MLVWDSGRYLLWGPDTLWPCIARLGGWEELSMVGAWGEAGAEDGEGGCSSLDQLLFPNFTPGLG